MNDISLAKATIRKQILSLRRETNSNSLTFTHNLLAVVQMQSPNRVATYVSFGTEPSTLNFIQSLIDQGIPVLVPETLENGELSWHDFIDGSNSSLLPGDLLFVPALAADREGNRLGRGKGYFDRELSGLIGITRYAVIYQNELIEQVPTESHDQRVDGVVTEEQILKIN